MECHTGKVHSKFQVPSMFAVQMNAPIVSFQHRNSKVFCVLYSQANPHFQKFITEARNNLLHLIRSLKIARLVFGPLKFHFQGSPCGVNSLTGPILALCWCVTDVILVYYWCSAEATLRCVFLGKLCDTASAQKYKLCRQVRYIFAKCATISVFCSVILATLI